jgi:hypothetical protein
MIKRDRTKPVIEKKYREIEVGDVIFDECHGPCSGGALYDIGDRVLRVTKYQIYTKDHSFYRKNGIASSPPTAYSIAFYQKDTRKRKIR